MSFETGLQFLDSADHYTAQETITLKWNRNVGGGTRTTTSGRNGRGLDLRGNQGVGKTVAHVGTSTVGFAMKFDVEPGGGFIYQVYHVGTFLGGLYVEFDGSVSYRANLGFSTNVFYNTGTIPLDPPIEIKGGVWYYFEVKTTVLGGESSTVTLTLEARINGQQLEVKTGDTGFTGGQLTLFDITGTTVNYHEFMSPNVNGSTILDDTYIANDGNFRGDIKISAIYPNGDVTTQWQQSAAGNAFSLVNEHAPDDDATYIFSPNPSDLENFEWEDIPLNSDTVVGVHYLIYHRKDEEGTRAFKFTFGASGAVLGPEIFPGDSYRYDSWAMDTIPSGGAWTPVAFNNSRFGVQITR